MRTAIVACVLACVGIPAVAQEGERSPTTVEAGIPDPATVAVPVITGGRDERVVRDGWKHFYFWRADTTFAEAYGDFADCYRFLPVADADDTLPTFVAWQGPESVNETEVLIGSNYGLLGPLVAAGLSELVSGPIDRRASQSRMRRCMEPRGYLRFPATEEDWQAITDNYSINSLAVSAALASGPRPDAEPVRGDR